MEVPVPDEGKIPHRNRLQRLEQQRDRERVPERFQEFVTQGKVPCAVPAVMHVHCCRVMSRTYQ